MTTTELFTQAYANTHIAADVISQIADSENLTMEQAVQFERLTCQAHTAALALKSRVAGNPPPKNGD